MSYYVRVLARSARIVPPKKIVAALERDLDDPDLTVTVDHRRMWNELVLSHKDGSEIAVVERNVVSAGELGSSEIEEFLEDIKEYKPESAVTWLEKYLPKVKVVYAFQILDGADHGDGWAAIHAVKIALWSALGGIVQADYEGFSNDYGNHILWQFEGRVSGIWEMGVLNNGKWRHFKMELSNREHRASFLRGEVPPGVKAVSVPIKKSRL